MTAVRKTRNASSKKSPLALMLILFLSGYLMASFWSMSDLIDLLSKKSSPNHTNNRLAALTQAKKQDLPQPKFEFYTLLSNDHHKPDLDHSLTKNKEVTVPEKAADKSTKLASVETAKAIQSIAAPASSKKNTIHHRYFDIQAASFKSRQVAEKMQAKLLLSGLDAKVVDVVHSGKHWYRVMIGPFEDKKEAEHAQLNIAKSEHIMGIILKHEA